MDTMARLGWLAIAAVVVLAYLNGLDAPFVYDDRIEVVGNATIRDMGQWAAIAQYNVSRMLLVWTYAWNFHSFGLDPNGYHVFSLVVHLLTIGAALGMARALGKLGGHPFPLLAAVGSVGLWAVHPMGVEAVTYITGRSESLCALFCCTAMGLWATALRAEREGGSGRWGRILGIVCTLAALLSKEVAGMLPLVLLSMEIFFGPASRPWLRRPRWAWIAPLLVLIGAAAWARFVYAGVLLPREVDRSLAVQLTTQTEVWLRYVQLWLVPVGQTLFHHVPDSGPMSGRGMASILGWVGLVGGSIWWGRRHPLAGFALLTGALFLVPSSSFVPLKESMAEHRAYTLGLYLSLAMAWSLTEGGRRWWMWTGVLLVPVLVICTVWRNQVWSSEIALWTEATERNPEVADAWYGLGDARRFSTDFGGAIAAYEQAVSLDPDHLDAWNNLGIAKVQLGDQSGARAAWHAALRRRPSYCKAHSNLGGLALDRGDLDEALVELFTTLEHCPYSASAHYRLGTLFYEDRRDTQRAVQHYEAMLKISPRHSRAALVRERLLELTW
jgi:cytochrome c-type biogenesis protein CcmH/NrfG